MSPPPVVGFYGKLPSHGDFLRRRTSDPFVVRWDAWLTECMAASRAALGPRWLDVFLTSPAWRFAAAPGACGSAAMAGVLAPSVDRVGRYFPLTVVSELPDGVSPVAAAAAAHAFFERAERLVIDTLEAERVDFDRFDDQVASLGLHLAGIGQDWSPLLDAAAGAALGDGAQGDWQIPLSVPLRPGRAFEQMLAQRLSTLYDPLVLWWTEGSAIVEATCLISKGLPSPDRFVGLLDGQWAERRWRSVSASTPPAPMAAEPPPIVDGPPLRFRSASTTDVGRVRAMNQDACLERPEAGVWVVADGLGGHKDGDVASRMVCDALADLPPGPSFDTTIDDARERLQRLNEHLVRAGLHVSPALRTGSTVVALFARGTECGVLWAGDSRAYRFRGGALERLTRDHSLAEADGADRDEMSHVVTRAIGAEPGLQLDLYRDRIRAGDRFLLCSDGLTHSLPDDRIRRWMGEPEIRGAVDGLISATLDAGAPDNVTALIVEASV